MWARAHTLADTILRPSQGQTPGQPGGQWKFRSGLGSTNMVWRLPAEPVAGWGSTVANGVVGSPPYPAWLCPPCGASALKFPVEFSILWRNRGVGRGGRCSGSKTQPLPGHFLLCWKEPLGPVRVASPVLSSWASSSPLWTSGPSPCPALTTERPVPLTVGAAPRTALPKHLCCVRPSSPLPPCVPQGAASTRADAPVTSFWAQWSRHLADRSQGPGSP